MYVYICYVTQLHKHFYNTMASVLLSFKIHVSRRMKASIIYKSRLILRPQAPRTEVATSKYTYLLPANLGRLFLRH
jgi:hypothetical protein